MSDREAAVQTDIDEAWAREFVLKCIDAGFVIHRELGTLNPYGGARSAIESLTAELLAMFAGREGDESNTAN